MIGRSAETGFPLAAHNVSEILIQVEVILGKEPFESSFVPFEDSMESLVFGDMDLDEFVSILKVCWLDSLYLSFLWALFFRGLKVVGVNHFNIFIFDYCTKRC